MEGFYNLLHKLMMFVLSLSDAVMGWVLAVTVFLALALMNTLVNVFIMPELMYIFLSAWFALKVRRYYLNLK
jgi:hypothetical protein